VIEKARAANSLRALTGEERNSSRSRRARDGHRFESPQLHQEVHASRRDFPGVGKPTTPVVTLERLGVRGVLHGLDALLDRLKSCGEHGCGQLGYALAIADGGFDPLLDQPLL
jgi:hypothetical protein